MAIREWAKTRALSEPGLDPYFGPCRNSVPADSNQPRATLTDSSDISLSAPGATVNSNPPVRRGRILASPQPVANPNALAPRPKPFQLPDRSQIWTCDALRHRLPLAELPSVFTLPDHHGKLRQAAPVLSSPTGGKRRPECGGQFLHRSKNLLKSGSYMISVGFLDHY